MNYALSLLKEIIKKRKLVWDLGKADFRKRFVGSYFGIVWMFIQPVVTIGLGIGTQVYCYIKYEYSPAGGCGSTLRIVPDGGTGALVLFQ